MLIIFTVYAVDVVVEDIDGVAGDIVDLVGVVASSGKLKMTKYSQIRLFVVFEQFEKN